MRYLLLILLLAVSVQAGQLEVTELPWVIDYTDHSEHTWDTVTISGTLMSSATSGIYFQSLYGHECQYWLLDLGIDTLDFGTGNGDNNYGIQVAGTSIYHANNIVVSGGLIRHNPSDTTVSGNICINFRGDNCTFSHVDAEVRGYNAFVFDGGGSGGGYCYDNDIIGGNWRSYSSGFTSRCDFDGVVCNIDGLRDSTLTNQGGSYHFKLDSLTISGGPHVGICIYGYSAGFYARSIITNCDITTDARNEFYLTNDGICHSAANPYAVSLTYVDGGTIIANNTIRSGTEFGGNRGIYVAGVTPDTANPVEIYGNDVSVHEGPTVELGDASPSHGLRMRYDVGVTNVHDNTLTCTVDSDEGTLSYGLHSHPIRISLTDDAAILNIYNNTINAVSNSATGTTGNGVTFDAVDFPNKITLYNNNITSFNHIYQFGEVNGQGDGHTGVTIYEDTIQFAETTIDPVTFYLGYLRNNWLCGYNKARDISYGTGTSDTNIVFSSGGTLDLTVQRTLDLYVQGSNSLPVEDAICYVWNNYGALLYTDTSTVGGQFGGIVSYHFESRTETDSLFSSFNDFTIRCVNSAGTDSVTITDFTVNSTAANATDTLTLPNTTGTGEWGQSPPPDEGRQYPVVKFRGGKL